jgi:ATP-dependent Lon protease
MADVETPVTPGGDNEKDLRMEIPEVLNLLPLRDTVVFPVLIVPIAVGRESSIKLIDDSVVGGNRIIGVVAMKDPTVENPTLDDVYRVGAAVAIRMMGKMPDGIRLIAQGISRIEILEAVQTQPYLRVRVRVVQEPTQISEEDSLEIEALRRNIAAAFQKVVQLSPNLPDELEGIALNVTEPHVLTDLVAAHLPVSIADKQKILETFDLKERMRLLLQMLVREVEVLELGSKLQSEVHLELSKTQREYYLREQLKAIQRELGEMDENMAQIEELRQKIAEAKMSPEAEKEALRELDRLSRIPSASPEYTVARTYIETMVALPWEHLHRGQSGHLAGATGAGTKTTTGWRRSKSAFWSISRCASSRPRAPCVSQSCVWWVRRAWGRPVWDARLPVRWAGSSCVSRWVASAMRQRFVDTVAPTLVHCPDKSFRVSGGQAPTTPSLCWMR